MRGGEDGLADRERGEAEQLADDERARSEDDPFAASTARRCGTAVMVARIIPVPYSELIDQHPERADRDLGEVEAVDAGQGGVESVRAVLAVEKVAPASARR